jgi:hypothetical protein
MGESDPRKMLKQQTCDGCENGSGGGGEGG